MPAHVKSIRENIKLLCSLFDFKINISAPRAIRPKSKIKIKAIINISKDALNTYIPEEIFNVICPVINNTVYDTGIRVNKNITVFFIFLKLSWDKKDI
jgi:hypothetical protein